MNPPEKNLDSKVPVAVRWILGALMAGTLCGWTIVLSLYVRAAILLGRWPRLDQDDPKDLGLGAHYTATGAGAVVWVIATICIYLIVALLVATKRAGRSEVRRYLFFALLSTVLWAAPPWVSWYLD